MTSQKSCKTNWQSVIQVNTTTPNNTISHHAEGSWRTSWTRHWEKLNNVVIDGKVIIINTWERALCTYNSRSFNFNCALKKHFVERFSLSVTGKSMRILRQNCVFYVFKIFIFIFIFAVTFFWCQYNERRLSVDVQQFAWRQISKLAQAAQVGNFLNIESQSTWRK